MDTLSTGKCWTLLVTAIYVATYVPKLVWSTVTDLSLGDIFKLFFFWPFCIWVIYHVLASAETKGVGAVLTFYNWLFSSCFSFASMMFTFITKESRIQALEEHYKKCETKMGSENTLSIYLGFFGIKDCYAR